MPFGLWYWWSGGIDFKFGQCAGQVAYLGPEASRAPAKPFVAIEKPRVLQFGCKLLCRVGCWMMLDVFT